MTKQDIITYLGTHKPEFTQRYGVTRMGLFGSYAKGTEHSESDIDIIVEMDAEHKTLRSFLGLKRTLEAALGATVDLGVESALKPAVKSMVKHEIIYV